MKLSRDIAQQQAARLQSSPKICPQSAEGRREVVDCILRHCQDGEHAERTMTAVLDSAREIDNLTAEIAQAARESRSAEVAPPGCRRCYRKDPFTGEVEWLAHVPTERNGHECAARCTCERGQWLAAKDAARQLEDPTPRKTTKMAKARDSMKAAAGDRE